MSPKPPRRPLIRRKSSRVHHDITPIFQEPLSRSNTFKTSIIIALIVVLVLAIFTPRSRNLSEVPIEGSTRAPMSIKLAIKTRTSYLAVPTATAIIPPTSISDQASKRRTKYEVEGGQDIHIGGIRERAESLSAKEEVGRN